MMPNQHNDDQVGRLVSRLGPHVDRFADWAGTEFWSRCERTALDLGFTPLEATAIAMTAVKHAIQGLAGAVEQARRDRLFRKMG